MDYIAHKREDGKEQTIKEHLTNTAAKAADFAAAFNDSQMAYLCGLVHDIGKYSSEFQNRIQGGANRCDHSTAGARLIKENIRLGLFNTVLEHCIAGHHSGLQNYGSQTDLGGEGTLCSRLTAENRIPDYSRYADEINFAQFVPVQPGIINKISSEEGEHLGFILSFYTRMLFSCLVDADYLDTESFMSNYSADRTVAYDFAAYLKKLEAKTASFSKDTIINKTRSEIYTSCVKKADSEPGLFTLTVPTGGGKTLSSMAFALHHLVRNNMNRIIYVIPYTSIIEQNAKVFAELFGTDVVLEHHSNFEFDDTDEKYNKKKLATENWDYPLIVTTNVQFFESLFANKSSKCRKLHNIANSILIFDEAQMFPLDYLQPCVDAIAELVLRYNCTAVLCSATQPALKGFFSRNLQIKEISDDIQRLEQIFQRVELINKGFLSDDQLAEEIQANNQCLCIVNTRKHARKIFAKLHEDEGAFHLSTLMCPEHRSATIKEIKERLIEGKVCIVISTRLIEAGVDVDFPVVYRSLAGLDSVVQSAGRCNREGKLLDEFGNKTTGKIYLFEPEEEYRKHQPSDFKRAISVTEEINRHYDDLLSNASINAYFKQLYYLNGQERLDSKMICRRLNDGLLFNRGELSIDFQDIASDFNLIEDNTYSVIIPYNEEAKELIIKLSHADYSRGLLRQLQRYTVNIYQHELNCLYNQGCLQQVEEKVFVLRDTLYHQYYSYKTGLQIKEMEGQSLFY